MHVCSQRLKQHAFNTRSKPCIAAMIHRHAGSPAHLLLLVESRKLRVPCHRRLTPLPLATPVRVPVGPSAFDVAAADCRRVCMLSFRLSRPETMLLMAPRPSSPSPPALCARRAATGGGRDSPRGAADPPRAGRCGQGGGMLGGSMLGTGGSRLVGGGAACGGGGCLLDGTLPRGLPRLANACTSPASSSASAWARTAFELRPCTPLLAGSADGGAGLRSPRGLRSAACVACSAAAIASARSSCFSERRNAFSSSRSRCVSALRSTKGCSRHGFALALRCWHRHRSCSTRPFKEFDFFSHCLVAGRRRGR